MDKIGPKFEVGKTYVCTNGLKVRCLYPYETDLYNCMFGEVLENTSTREIGEKDKFSGSAWSEYREPVVMKTKRHVGLWHGSIHVTRARMTGSMENIGEIEVTVTDGKLTDVKIL